MDSLAFWLLIGLCLTFACWLSDGGPDDGESQC